MTNKPAYLNGEPTNLQAAALASSPSATPPGAGLYTPSGAQKHRGPLRPRRRPKRRPGHFVDALDWLRVVARQPSPFGHSKVVRSVVQGRPKDPRIKAAVWNENLFRLRLAIEALEEFLPDDASKYPEGYDESGGGDGST